MITGQGAALLGSALYSVILVLYLKQLTGSATVLGIVEFLAFLPWVVIGPLAGTLVDRVNRRSVIVWSCLIRGMFMVILFLVSWDYFAGLTLKNAGLNYFNLDRFPFAVYVIFLVTACMGIIDSALNAALNSIIPAILPKENIQKGNSIFQGMGGVLAMVGNTLGGIFFTMMGAAPAFLINGASYFCAAFTSGSISLNPGKTSGTNFSCMNFWMETREGFRFIWRNKGLRNQTIIYTLSNLFFPMVMIALPFLIEDVMKLKGSYYGYLLSIMTFSSIITYFVFGSLKMTERQNYRMICSVFFIEALLFMIISFAMNIFFVFGLFGLLSGCMAVSRLINTSIKQKIIPDNLRGRVFGTLDSINGALAPVSFAVGGIVIDLLNKKVSILFTAIFAAYGLLAVIFVLNRPIRKFYLNSEPTSITETIA